MTTSPPHVATPGGGLRPAELQDAWPLLSLPERLEGFRLLAPGDAEEFFLGLPAREQAELVLALPAAERRLWVRLLAPDDAADLIQEAPAGERAALLDLLDPQTRSEVRALLAYAEDVAGGLMHPRYARLRPDMTVDEAVSYLRRQAREQLGTIYYGYVLDADQRLLGVVSFRELLSAPSHRTVGEIMRTDLVTVAEHTDQETVSRLFAEHDLIALPVVDAGGRMKGVVTVDDVVDVVQEEATEDIQKFGGLAALDRPYLQVGFWTMVRKRAGWLSALFVGEMLTATAMGHYEEEIARAVVLALFVPLIISSGGNSGSQASTLVIRAMALGEIRLRDWWRVARRELAAGLSLGCILATIGLVRILAWQELFGTYGEHYALVAVTVALSLIGVVLWGTLAGAMLPFVLRRLGFDPASASAPFVATLVDVSGIVIYFTVASAVLRGVLL
ncbi:MAG TPA: magnesium transporter [Thermodesulfobacteriota bacterium]|nr:magnesium transporter [Thermodesulfobacteriota bacterium]